jgi:hypothetical protein
MTRLWFFTAMERPRQQASVSLPTLSLSFCGLKYVGGAACRSPALGRKHVGRIGQAVPRHPRGRWPPRRGRLSECGLDMIRQGEAQL